jgi:Lar family restriction alleviation protein
VKLQNSIVKVGVMTMELKPCPFCGGKAEVVDNEYFVDVSCAHIHCRGYAASLMYNNKKEAIEAWNRRADNG